MSIKHLIDALTERSTASDLTPPTSFLAVTTTTGRVIAYIGLAEDDTADLAQDLHSNADYRTDADRLGKALWFAPIGRTGTTAYELRVLDARMTPVDTVPFSEEDIEQMVTLLDETAISRAITTFEATGPVANLSSAAEWRTEYPYLAADIADAGEWPDENDLGHAIDQVLTISAEQLPTLTGDVLRNTPAPQQRAVLAALDDWFGQIPDSLAHEDDDWDGTL